MNIPALILIVVEWFDRLPPVSSGASVCSTDLWLFDARGSPGAGRVVLGVTDLVLSSPDLVQIVFANNY